MLRTMTVTQSDESRDALLGSEWPEVLRVASELYARDRLEIESASQSNELKQAAEEVGLPPEYLERATAVLAAERQARAHRRLARWRRLRLASALAITLAVGWVSIRLTLPAPEGVRTPISEWRHGKNLRGANLAGSDLAGQNLDWASLRGAILTNANLRGATLRAADLRGAALTGADLAGTDLVGAIYDGSTRWPKGYDPAVHHVRRVR